MKNNQSCTLYVAGMHCSACEVLLEKNLKKFDGVVNVDADISKKVVEVEFTQGNAPDISKINERFKELGYTFSDEPIGEGSLNYQNSVQVAGVFIFLILTFVILQDLNVFTRFSLNETSSLPAFLHLEL